MNLLPRVSSEFSDAKYWESFFKKRKSSFEWYGNYLELCGILHRYIKVKDDILVVGCGNSELSEQLYDSGFIKIINIDISKTVLDKMRKKNEKRVEMTWVEMDLTKLNLADDSVSVVLDKGTLDALMSDSSEEANENIENIFKEISRVLRFGGRYICITLAQDHILKALFNFFPNENWIVRIHKVWTSESHEKIDMPVFTLIFTKFKNLPEKIFEICLEDGVKPIRLNNMDDAIEMVKTQQYYAMVRRKLASENTDEPVAVTLFSSENIESPRYTIHVVDSENHKHANKFGVFIVPRGREREWLFNSNEGRRQVAESAQFKRLAFASLNRDHQYTGMQEIQKELSAKVMELAPNDLPPHYKAPFLSVGKDAIGEQYIRFKGQSSITGSVIVEDHLGDEGIWVRELLFDSTLVQTAVRLKEKSKPTNKSGKKKKKAREQAVKSFDIDPNHFASQYVKLMVAGVAGNIDSCDTQFRSLILGLGGGSLARHLLRLFQQCHVTAIEIDPLVIDVCRDWFGLSAQKFGKRLQILADDAMHHVMSSESDNTPLYEFIFLDIDLKDETSSVRCPPPQFLSSSFLKQVEKLLTDDGIFFMNFASRDVNARNEAIEQIRVVFPHIFMIKCEESINVILYCLKENKIINLNIIEEWKKKATKLERTTNNLDLSQSFSDIVRIS